MEFRLTLEELVVIVESLLESSALPITVQVENDYLHLKFTDGAMHISGDIKFVEYISQGTSVELILQHTFTQHEIEWLCKKYSDVVAITLFEDNLLHINFRSIGMLGIYDIRFIEPQYVIFHNFIPNPESPFDHMSSDVMED